VGEVGFFGARGPSITAGYWSDADATYRSKLGGYWLTGDLVYQDEDGNYYVVDRTADAIETAEGTGYSVLMEEVLLSEISAITDCAVVAGRHDDRIVPVAVVIAGVIGGDSPAEARRLLAAANEALEKAGHPRIAVLDIARTPDDFPVGVTGKVLKRELRARYNDLAESPRPEHRAVAAFMTHRPDSAVA
jgi:acyl-coenzyme A synthetase/AMP-(fatty) acid ligase